MPFVQLDNTTADYFIIGSYFFKKYNMYTDYSSNIVGIGLQNPNFVNPGNSWTYIKQLPLLLTFLGLYMGLLTVLYQALKRVWIWKGFYHKS